ncbi:MAG: glycosyltransferase [Gemmatimonadaceae bacterium]
MPQADSVVFVVVDPARMQGVRERAHRLRQRGLSASVLDASRVLPAGTPGVRADGRLADDVHALVPPETHGLRGSSPALVAWLVHRWLEVHAPTRVVAPLSRGILAMALQARAQGTGHAGRSLLLEVDSLLTLDALRGGVWLDDPVAFTLDAMERDALRLADRVVVTDAALLPLVQPARPAERSPVQLLRADDVAAWDKWIRATATGSATGSASGSATPLVPEAWPGITVCVAGTVPGTGTAPAWSFDYAGAVERIATTQPSVLAAWQQAVASSTAAGHDWLCLMHATDQPDPALLTQLMRAALRERAALATCGATILRTRGGTITTEIVAQQIVTGSTMVEQLLESDVGPTALLCQRALWPQLVAAAARVPTATDPASTLWVLRTQAAALGATLATVSAPLVVVPDSMPVLSAQTEPARAAAVAQLAASGLPPRWRDVPLVLQGFHQLSVRQAQRIQSLEQEVVRGRQIAAERDGLRAAIANGTAAALAPRVRPTVPTVDRAPRCYVWHEEGMGISGILAWMWRLREQFAPAAQLPLELIDLSVLPYRSEQLADPTASLYDRQITTSPAFVQFLEETASGVHLINHCYRYVTSLLEQYGPDTLRRLSLVGVCHTDQEFYYANLEKLAPVLRGIIAVSETCTVELKRRIPAMADRIVTLPAWAVSLPDTVATRTAGEPLRLLYTGRIVQYQKRVFDLAALAGALGQTGVNAELTIVGNGPDLPALRDRLQALPQSIPVHFDVPRAPWAMTDVIARSHVLVQTSEFEGASVSLMEALAFGLVPVVTVTRSGHDLLEHDQNALVADVGDIATLARHIGRLAASPTDWSRVATGARATAERYLTALDYPQRFAETIRRFAP